MARRCLTHVRLHMWASGQRNCYYCDTAMTRAGNQPNTLTVDHKTPVGRGGAEDRRNYAACCYRCNNAKGSLNEREFRELLAAGLAFEPGSKERAKRIAFADAMEAARRERRRLPAPPATA